MGILTKIGIGVLIVGVLAAEWHYSGERIQKRVEENKAHQLHQGEKTAPNSLEVIIPPGASTSSHQQINRAVGN